MSKLKYSDLKSRSKIILNVNWEKLSANDLPYLSVSIEQVRLNGEVVGNWQDQKAAIKLIDPEFSELVKFHLYDPNGYGIHFITNNIYHFEQLRNDVFNLSVSKESYIELQDQLVNNFMVNFKTIKTLNLKEVFLTHIKKPLYNNNLNFIKWFKSAYHVSHFEKRVINGLSNLAFFKKDYHLLSDKIKGAKSRSEVWTIEKYVNMSGIDQDMVRELLLDQDYKIKLKKLLTAQAFLNKLRLEQLTNKYSIKTIKG